jgi:hypothetical protein
MTALQNFGNKLHNSQEEAQAPPLAPLISVNFETNRVNYVILIVIKSLTFAS